MDAPDGRQPDALAAAVASIDQLIQSLGMDRSVIDVERLSFETGIPAERIPGLLDGMVPESETPQETFRKRLVFLRDTRLKPGGKKRTLDEIGEGAGISHGQVSYLLKGKRSPGVGAVSGLEAFFNVAPGFFTATERQALHRALQPIHEQLIHVALLRGTGISALAMRSSSVGSDDDRIGRELRAAVAEALQQPEEVRELTYQMRALPAKSRTRVFPLIRGILGLERPGGSRSTDSSPAGRS
ncbi:helix-turn-helix domain-containing protein [Streptomyces sp. NPDC001478]